MHLDATDVQRFESSAGVGPAVVLLDVAASGGCQHRCLVRVVQQLAHACGKRIGVLADQ
jgi:hypothetical protein